MVQLKYFGDDRDYFKYDLITHILSNKLFLNYGFVPMLTNHRDDNEGNIKPVKTMCKSRDLFNYIHACDTRDLSLWEKWLSKYVNDYNVVEPINEFYFSSEGRNCYWNKSRSVLSIKDALIFYDPDTGLEAGRKTKIKKQDKDKYVLNQDLEIIFDNMEESSVSMFYQHMQFNKHKRIDDIKRKTLDLTNMKADVNVVTYMEKDLSFVFIAKNKSLLSKLYSELGNYEENSSVSDKYLFSSM